MCINFHPHLMCIASNWFWGRIHPFVTYWGVSKHSNVMYMNNVYVHEQAAIVGQTLHDNRVVSLTIVVIGYTFIWTYMWAVNSPSNLWKLPEAPQFLSAGNGHMLGWQVSGYCTATLDLYCPNCRMSKSKQPGYYSVYTHFCLLTSKL